MAIVRINHLLFCIGCGLCGLFLFAFPAFAVTTTITNSPSSISSDAFTITVAISGASTGTNYLRIDLYKDGTSNYFGETFNGTTWYSGSEEVQYFPISIQSASWSGTLQGKINNFTTTDYDGTGAYKIRVRRYTSSGNYTPSEANNSGVAIAIAISTPTPSPTITPVPPTASPTPSPAAAAAPTPTKSPTGTPTPKITVTITPAMYITLMTTTSAAFATQSAKSVQNKDILGESIKEEKIPTPTMNSPTRKKGSILPSVSIIGGSIFLLSACGILGFNLYRTHV